MIGGANLLLLLAQPSPTNLGRRCASGPASPFPAVDFDQIWWKKLSLQDDRCMHTLSIHIFK